jgi:serine/threonine protein kinase
MLPHCYVYKAMDEMTAYDSSEPKIVGLKLMKKNDQFIRAITTRAQARFDPEYVIDIIKTYPMVEDADHLVVEEAKEVRGVATKDQAERLYCIVLPFADRNFIFMSQRFGYEEKKFIFIQLVKCLQHLHSKGVVHADLKPLNIIQEERNERKLISMLRVELATTSIGSQARPTCLRGIVC